MNGEQWYGRDAVRGGESDWGFQVAHGHRTGNDYVDVNGENIPSSYKSRWTNPGLFLARVKRPDERTDLTIGARVDWTATNVIDDPSKLEQLGILQLSLSDILGTEEWAQSYTSWALYADMRRELSPHWDLLLAAGCSQRPPSLTEMYAAQTSLFLLQNGENTATGDPLLRPERSWQADLGLQWRSERFRTGVDGYCALVQDYITFENMGVEVGPPAGQIEQTQLKYVNTDLAVLTGFEFYSEYDLTDWVTPFATLRFVDGRDLTRSGKFATRPAESGLPSERVYGLPRGAFSGIAGASSEPLPGIYPMESRLGVRLSPSCPHRDWGIELSVRIVDKQQRVASSLVEQPTPGFSVWDLRTYWRPKERLLLLAGVETFTDRQYQEHLDFRSPNGISVYQPGMNFYCGSEVRY